jgi:2-methylcitrate dehydratase PrpD
MCRASLVAPKKIHKAGFHPTAVLGAMGAAAGVAAALRVDERVFASAQGIAGSMAGGIIEYLAEGASTKRMHPGWAAQSGLRAVQLARAGFEGPRTVWEGTHGFLHGFANTVDGDWRKLLEGFGERWIAETIAFKPYACGTMIHPFIDCARRLSRALGDGRGKGSIDAIASITCDTAEGYVHRLWEPLDAKRRPPNPYAAKFSIPWCLGYALLHGPVGLEAFTDANVRDAKVLAIAGKVAYRVNPQDPYPNEYTGHVRITMRDGRVLEERQPHLRGGHREPLTRAEIEEKFRSNCAYGGWPRERAERWLAFARAAFDGQGIDIKEFRA